MRKRLVARTLVLALVFAAFSAGHFLGSVSERSAHAQIGGVLEQAVKGGALGPASDLGNSIIQMQEHVTGLQKNLETLKKVQSALTGK